MRYAWQLGLKIESAKHIDGKLYRFVLTQPDGTQVGYEYGKVLELELKKLIVSADKADDAPTNQRPAR